MSRLGYNAIKNKKARSEKRKRVLGTLVRWFGRKGWKITIVLAVLGVAVWQGWFWVSKLNPAELRTLRSVDITGNRMLTWEEILQAAGLETGMPMSEINADSVRTRLLSLPLLQDANVDVGVFWNVAINVTETEPVMEILENGRWKSYSSRGLALPIAASAVLDLPVATIHKNRDIKKLSSFLQVMRESDESLYKNVSQVKVDEKKHAIMVYFRDVNFEVLFPMNGDVEKSFHHYRQLLEGLPKEMQNVKSLDLRFEGFAYANSSAKGVK